MGIKEHPPQGSIVTVNYATGGFKEPEMVKRRLAVTLTPKIIARPHLCTVVPLSLTPPEKEMPYHCTIRIPFELPKEWGDAASETLCPAWHGPINIDKAPVEAHISTVSGSAHVIRV